jgi:hypothetical protein
MGLANGTMKYGFRIRTRSGMVVENLTIHGKDEADAERKLRQMYLHCQILECRTVGARSHAEPTFEDVIQLVTR